MTDDTLALSAWLDALAAKKPTPGGGAAAAVCGALAAAIGEMAANYTPGVADRPRMAEAVAALRRARAVMLELMREDQLAFDALSAARKSGDESAKADAVRWCTRVPLAIAGAAVGILRAADELHDGVNQFLRSDLIVCVEFATATVSAAAASVWANLSSLEAAERDAASREADVLIEHARQFARKIVPSLRAAIV